MLKNNTNHFNRQNAKLLVITITGHSNTSFSSFFTSVKPPISSQPKAKSLCKLTPRKSIGVLSDKASNISQLSKIGNLLESTVTFKKRKSFKLHNIFLVIHLLTSY